MVKGVKGFQKGHKHSEEVKKRIGDANRKQVYFNCDYCGQVSSDAPSSYNRKKRHFCSMGCYSEFRKNKLPMEEQNAYKGVRNPGESKQVYHRRYVKKHPERIAHLKARRYASERNAEGGHSGSPPRMRVKPGLFVDNYGLIGITPAHAGKTPLYNLRFISSRDHPRACG